jgi:hypothetical protein
MTYEKRKQKEIEAQKAHLAQKAKLTAEKAELFKSLNIQIGDFIEITTSKGSQVLFVEDSANTYDTLPFLKNILFLSFRGMNGAGILGMTCLLDVVEVKKVKGSIALLQEVEEAMKVSNRIFQSYNEAGSYKGD